MRYLYLFALVVFIGACKKCYCPVDPILPAFVSYTDVETDTIIVKRFRKGSNFSELVDSFSVTPYNSSRFQSNDTIMIFANNPFARIIAGYDWQVINFYDGKQVSISDITNELIETSCGGLFGWDRQACSSPVTSYKASGSMVPGGLFNPAMAIIKK